MGLIFLVIKSHASRFQCPGGVRWCRLTRKLAVFFFVRWLDFYVCLPIPLRRRWNSSEPGTGGWHGRTDATFSTDHIFKLPKAGVMPTGLSGIS